MKKKLSLLLTILLVSTCIFAQKPEIKFTETTYDFGTISEEDGKVTHIFEFTNTGTADLLLQNVQASCGCTTPQWVREPVAPKQKGTITVTYTTAGRPGPFTKTITVTSNADKQVLIIKGAVTPKGQTVEEAYPVLNGDVRIKSEVLNVGDVAAGDIEKTLLSVANISKKDVLVTLVGLPPYITAETKKLKADEKGNIALTINTTKIKEWGRINKDIYFITGDIKNKKTPKYKVTLSCNIYEKFTEQQLANAPYIQIADEISAGEVIKGKKKTVLLNYKNTGKAPLSIRKASGDDASIIIAPSKAIAPGTEGKIKVTIDASKLEAKAYRKNINLMLNDPQNVNKNVVLTFTVK